MHIQPHVGDNAEALGRLGGGELGFVIIPVAEIAVIQRDHADRQQVAEQREDQQIDAERKGRREGGRVVLPPYAEEDQRQRQQQNAEPGG